MNILIPDSWLRDFLDTDATPIDIQKCLSLCGPSIERLHKVDQPSPDFVYNIEVTTNRPDCMSVMGIAREAVAILPQFGFKAKLKKTSTVSLRPDQSHQLQIVSDHKLNERIVAVIVENVSIQPSPSWLQDRLEKVGQRPLNNLVDITNYIMWETGHPIHVFDLDRITTHKMVIREAKPGESLTTLDHKTHSLLGGEVVIDDGTGKIIDLPCIMGTENSVVTAETRRALFFIEDIDPVRVRRASMLLGIRTQAAILKEKDIDPYLSLTAIERAIGLTTQLLPASRPLGIQDIFHSPRKNVSISLTVDQINKLIGITIPKTAIRDILSRLGYSVTSSGKTLQVTPPTWRAHDTAIWQDIVEEVARVYGYHNIPPVLMTGTLPHPDQNRTFYWESRIKTTLKYLGFTETYTYSLVEAGDGLRLKNPLSSDWVYLRTSLFPSHLKVISQNQGRVESLNLFEIANVYIPRDRELPEEQTRLIVSSSSSDYFVFKGIISALIQDLGISSLDLDIRSDSGIFYWEIPFSTLLSKVTDTRTYIPISKYTPVIEDINVTHRGTYATIVKQIHSLSPLITQIDLIDTYGDKITLRLTFHSTDKQLSTQDISPIREKLGAFV